MAYIKTNAMERLICEVLFRGRTAPPIYYLGLGRGPLPTETSTLSDVTEVVGPGYQRERLRNGLVDFPELVLQDNDWKVGSVPVVFRAVGGDWTEIEYGFLTDVPNGVNGELFAVISVPPFRNHDTEDFNATFEYQDS